MSITAPTTRDDYTITLENPCEVDEALAVPADALKSMAFNLADRNEIVFAEDVSDEVREDIRGIDFEAFVDTAYLSPEVGDMAMDATFSGEIDVYGTTVDFACTMTFEGVGDATITVEEC